MDLSLKMMAVNHFLEINEIRRGASMCENLSLELMLPQLKGEPNERLLKWLSTCCIEAGTIKIVGQLRSVSLVFAVCPSNDPFVLTWNRGLHLSLGPQPSFFLVTLHGSSWQHGSRSCVRSDPSSKQWTSIASATVCSRSWNPEVL